MEKIKTHKNLERNDWIFLNLLTTGNNPEKGDIILKIEAIKVKDTKVIDNFSEEIKSPNSSKNILNNFYKWINPKKDYILVITKNYLTTINFLEFYNKKHNRTVPLHVGYDIDNLVKIFEYGYNNRIKTKSINNKDSNILKNIYNTYLKCLSMYDKNKQEFDLNMYQDEFIIMDTETSGLDPKKGAELLKIVAYKVKNGTITDKFCQLIKPQTKISKEVTELTGITNKQLNKGTYYQDVIKMFKNWRKELPLIIYNYNFDKKFFDYYNKDSKEKFNQNNCYELITILETKYRNLKTKSLTKIIKIVNEEYYNCLKKDDFYYLNIILYLLQDIHNNI